MKNLFLPLCFLLSTFVQAQQGTVSSKVQFTDKTPAEYTNVLLLQAIDSSLVKGMLTDATGSYLFEGLQDGSYKVVATMLGYSKARSKTVIISIERKDVQLEPLTLIQASTGLKEVVVEVQRPLIEQHLDKTVMNVENSIVSAGSTALEVLE